MFEIVAHAKSKNQSAASQGSRYMLYSLEYDKETEAFKIILVNNPYPDMHEPRYKNAGYVIDPLKGKITLLNDGDTVIANYVGSSDTKKPGTWILTETGKIKLGIAPTEPAPGASHLRVVAPPSQK